MEVVVFGFLFFLEKGKELGKGIRMMGGLSF